MADEAFSYSGKLAYLRRVCRDPRLTRTAMAVATVLVDYADRKTGKAYPSVQRIVAESGVSKSTSLRALRLLEQCGHMTATKQLGTNSLYCLTSPEADTGSDVGTGSKWAATGVISNLKAGRTGSDHGANVVPMSGPNQRKACKASGKEQTARVRESRFPEFWQAYPRHEGSKAKCEAAWSAKKLDGTAEQILADVAARKADAGQWLTIEKRYIPHPLTYLNGRRWEDEWVPAKATGVLPRDEADDDLAAYNAEAALRIGGANG